MPVSFVYIGKRVKEMRTHCGMSQARLAEKAELSAQYVCQIETGKKQASLQALYSIAQVLDVSLDALTGNPKTGFMEAGGGFGSLLDDCSEYERVVIKETVISLKESLKQNEKLLERRD